MRTKIASGIIALYPNAIINVDWHVTAYDGESHVTKWDDARLGPMPDLDVLEAAGVQAEQEVASERADRSTLRDQILGATEAQWLGLTEVQRQKVILKALKYMARNL